MKTTITITQETTDTTVKTTVYAGSELLYSEEISKNQLFRNEPTSELRRFMNWLTGQKQASNRCDVRQHGTEKLGFFRKIFLQRFKFKG